MPNVKDVVADEKKPCWVVSLGDIVIVKRVRIVVAVSVVVVIAVVASLFVVCFFGCPRQRSRLNPMMCLKNPTMKTKKKKKEDASRAIDDLLMMMMIALIPFLLLLHRAVTSRK